MELSLFLARLLSVCGVKLVRRMGLRPRFRPFGRLCLSRYALRRLASLSIFLLNPAFSFFCSFIASRFRRRRISSMPSLPRRMTWKQSRTMTALGNTAFAMAPMLFDKSIVMLVPFRRISSGSISLFITSDGFVPFIMAMTVCFLP